MKVEIYEKAIERLAKWYGDRSDALIASINGVIEAAVVDHDCGNLTDREYAKIVKMAADVMYPEGEEED